MVYTDWYNFFAFSVAFFPSNFWVIFVILGVLQPKVVTVVLKVRMHCDACSLEIKKRIERMKGNSVFFLYLPFFWGGGEDILNPM